MKSLSSRCGNARSTSSISASGISARTDAICNIQNTVVGYEYFPGCPADAANARNVPAMRAIASSSDGDSRK